jgi:hypothetical protein
MFCDESFLWTCTEIASRTAPALHAASKPVTRGQPWCTLPTLRLTANAARFCPRPIIDHDRNIDTAVEDRRAVLATLTIGQLALEYGREFRTAADIAAGKGELIERLLLELQHELEAEKASAIPVGILAMASRGREKSGA